MSVERARFSPTSGHYVTEALLPFDSAAANQDATGRIRDFVSEHSFANAQCIIAQNLEKRIYHLRAPSQLDLYRNSRFAKASDTSEYSAQFTTCGWVAAYLVHHLCNILSQNSKLPKEEIQLLLEKSSPDAFIRKATQFVGDLTAYGGSNDKVEGLLLGQEIYDILEGSNPPCLKNVFIIEGATEEADLKIHADALEIFNLSEPFVANCKQTEDFEPLRRAIDEVSTGTRPFVVLVSLATFPLGDHFATYTFRLNSQNSLECLLFEGLNEAHFDWVSFGAIPSTDKKRRSTTEWIYNEMINSTLGL
jgi:hypothetical protein